MSESIFKWEMLERSFLDPYHHYAVTHGERAGFTAEHVAGFLKIETSEATDLIQSYLDAQRSKESKTQYVLRREGRTKSAIWYAGARAKDARAQMGQFSSDVHRRITRALEPDLRHIGELNPRALSSIEQGLTPAIEAFSNLISSVITMTGFVLDEQDRNGDG